MLLRDVQDVDCRMERRLCWLRLLDSWVDCREDRGRCVCAYDLARATDFLIAGHNDSVWRGITTMGNEELEEEEGESRRGRGRVMMFREGGSRGRGPDEHRRLLREWARWRVSRNLENKIRAGLGQTDHSYVVLCTLGKLYEPAVFYSGVPQPVREYGEAHVELRSA